MAIISCKIRGRMTPQEIRQLRKDLGLTQEAAGALLGVGPSAFHKYETGKSRPGTAACELLVRIRQEIELPAAYRTLGNLGLATQNA